MLNTRKMFFAMASMSLMAVGAYAQSCAVTSVPLALRPEGLAETTGNIVLTCSSLSAGGATVLVTLNANISNTTTVNAQAVFNSDPAVFGVLNTAIPNSISFPAGNLVSGSNTITISGIRVNASTVAPNTAITATIIVTSGPAVLPLSPNPTTVGFVLPASYTFSVVGGSSLTASPLPGSPSLPICVTNSSITGFLRFTELFSGVFRTQANEGPGATNATQLAVTFANIPSGVTLLVPNQTFTTGNNVISISGVGSATSSTISTGYTPATGDTAYAGTYGAPTGSTVTFTIVTDSINTVDTLSIPFIARFTGSPTNGTGTATALGTLAPSSSTSFPRFITTGTTANLFTTATCSTTLLWPYVTNAAGFDTGVAISNTSADPRGTAAQSGTCTINYYGAFESGAALPSAATTSTIAAGRFAAFSLSAGGSGVPALASAGFTGYLIGVCNFQLAHGYAFISDLGARNLAHGYLALIIPGTGSRVSGSGTETLDN